MKRERNINYRAAENQPREADDRIKMTEYVHTLKVVLVWHTEMKYSIAGVEFQAAKQFILSSFGIQLYLS